METWLPFITRDMTNEQIAKAFADQFDPPLVIGKTLAINSVPYKDAWTCSWIDKDTNVGVMAVFYDGRISAYLEAKGPGSMSADAGRIMASAFGRYVGKAPNGQAE